MFQPFQARGVFVNIYGYGILSSLVLFSFWILAEMAKFETSHQQKSDVEGEPSKTIVTKHEETREFFRERINGKTDLNFFFKKKPNQPSWLSFISLVWSVGGLIGVGNYNVSETIINFKFYISKIVSFSI